MQRASAAALVYRRRMNRGRLVRLGVLAALLVAALFVRYGTEWGASLSTAKVRELVQNAGAAGVLLFMAAFAIGELLHVPGLVFVAAAVLSWGRLAGGAIAYTGAIVSVSLSFAVVRGIGGKALAEVDWKARRWRLVAKLMDQLERRPVATVAVLRMIMWIAPALNYALALSAVRFRDYLLGSAIGLALPLAAAAAFFQYLLK
jgi:uncharacterized membrane protein YdjX (TVP38/TMEM64 family)